MRILYVASDQTVPGHTGGSVHVEEVARGLSARGHEMHVVALAGEGARPKEFELHRSQMLVEHRLFRWTARRGVSKLIERLDVDAVMERYYNFAGEGVRAAHDRGIPALLEVNAPVKDYPGSLKSTLDRLALVRPMERLRDTMCARASALVTPLLSIVPETVPSEKVHRVSWGANVERFRPDVAKKPLAIPDERPVIVFSGSFRPWHGADMLVRAATKLPDAFFLFVGDGPCLDETKALAETLDVSERVHFAGAVAYDEVPMYLRWASVGVAPYQPSRLGQMQLGFFWSPLKIFEYMAMALPVISLDVPPLREILDDGGGTLVPEGDVDVLVRALDALTSDPADAQTKGLIARERVVAEYSWQRHCEQLEQILSTLVDRSASAS